MLRQQNDHLIVGGTTKTANDVFELTTSIVKPDKIDKGRVVKFAAIDTSSYHELAVAVPSTV